MITAVYVKAPDVVGLSIQGHAGAAPRGQDIVCAAVSGIVESLRLYISRFPECSANDDGDVLTLAAPATFLQSFDAASMGLMALSEQFPENVHFALRPARRPEQ